MSTSERLLRLAFAVGAYSLIARLTLPRPPEPFSSLRIAGHVGTALAAYELAGVAAPYVLQRAGSGKVG